MYKYLIFINLFVLTCITYIIKNEIENKNVIYNFYSTQLSYEQIELLFHSYRKFDWIEYLFIPIIYFFKLSTISICIYTGLIFTNVEKPDFFKIFSIVAISNTIFLFPGIIKIFWFSFNPNYTLEDLKFFMPGSLLNLFNPKEIEPWLIYPLQSFNIWELAFWFALAYELREYFKKDFIKSISTVMASYGSGFLIWVVFVVFLTLNFS